MSIKRGTFQKLRPLNLLTHLSSCYDSAHLQIFSGVYWSIYLEQGKVTYASHSVDPFDRLERHLRRLSDRIPTFESESLTQLRLMFDTDLDGQSIQNPDCQAICWLVNHQYLNAIQAAALIEELTKEVLESLLLVKEGTYELGYKLDSQPEFCKLDLQPTIEHCKKQLQGWQSLGPEIWSPYQRPYFLSRTKDQQQILPEIQHKLSTSPKGLSFRHLAVMLERDELQLAESLHPYIVEGSIFLNDPLAPFDRLPKTFEPLPKTFEQLAKPFEPLVKPLKQLADIHDRPPESFQKLETVISNAGAEQLSKQFKRSPIPDRPLEQIQKLERPTSTTEKQLTFAVSASELSELETQPNTTVTDDTAKREAAPVDKRSYTIVCVDDSPTILKEISYFLEDESFSVFTISNPLKALMQVIRLKPDLILLDVRMTGMDGYELCRLLRNHPLFKNTPIIMVTGNTGIIDRVKARLVGASGYLTKPFTQSDLLKMVFRHLT